MSGLTGYLESSTLSPELRGLVEYVQERHDCFVLGDKLRRYLLGKLDAGWGLERIEGEKKFIETIAMERFGLELRIT